MTPTNGAAGPATRRIRILERIRRLVLGPSVVSEQCTAELQVALGELRKVTEEGRQLVQEGQAKLASGESHAGP